MFQDKASLHRNGLGCFRLRSARVRLDFGLLISGLADINAALEEGAILNRDALRYDIARERAFAADVHSVTGVHVAAHFAEDDNFTGRDVRGYLSIAPHSHTIARKIDGPFYFAINVQR